MVYFSKSHGARGIKALFENIQLAFSEIKVQPFTVVRCDITED